MNATAPDEREFLDILIPQLARFAAENIDPLQIDQTGHIPPELIRSLGELGVFSLSIPPEYGGAGLSLDSVCRVVSKLAEYDRSVATTVGLHVGLGTRPIIAYGSELLRKQMLPRMATGEWVASFAATEANAGSDLTAIATTGVAQETELVLNGSKAYVTNGGFARVLTLLVSTPGLGGSQRGHSLICLKRDDPGVSFGGEEDKLGLRGSSTRPLFVDDVVIDASRIIGAPGKGMDLVYDVLAWGRTAMAAGCLGAATAAMNATMKHVTTRRQFGRTLAQLPVVRGQLATMSALLFAMRALVHRTAALENDDRALAEVSTSAKIFCSEADWEITDMALQLHGGNGFLEDTGLPLLLRDARITRIFEGANDVLRIHAGGIEVASQSTRSELAARFPEDPLAEAADELSRVVDEWVERLRATHRSRLLADHRLLHAVGSAVVVRETSDAVVVEAADCGDDHSRANAAHWLDLARRQLNSVCEPLPPVAQVDAVLAGWGSPSALTKVT